ncbi:MAG: alkaline phosphatase family protein, partial [Polyangiaceae bacterium]
MRRLLVTLFGAASMATISLVACSDGADAVSTTPLEVDAQAEASSDDGSARSDAIALDAGASTTSKIEHVVVIVQENHAFDTYFGHYCTAATGSNPACNDGPACCEAAPTEFPTGVSPVVLDDAQNGARDPNHTQACELSEMNDGGMDMYTSGPSCANAGNFAVAATNGIVKPYLDLASQYALADRYFQPLVGQSTSNDMYLAVAKYVFTDNQFEPAATGHGCADPFANTTSAYVGQTTIADALIAGGVSFSYFAMGFDAMYATSEFECPKAPADCPISTPTLPCVYDPGDVAFEYYAQFQNNHTYMKDFDDDFVPAVANGTLPQVSFVKAVTYRNEHPGYGDTISKGVTFTTAIISSILKSPIYSENTLVLLTWDEGGGFFDHVTPPPNSVIDMQPYGTRVGMLAIGKFAKKNFVSHVQMEHSSIVKFLEQNFLGKTGQLNARDTVVNDIGSML